MEVRKKIIPHGVRGRTTHPYVWVAIPKVASRSIFYKLIHETSTEYSTSSPFQNLQVKPLGEIHKEEFTFTFIREPLERIVSCYLNKVKSGSTSLRRRWLQDEDVSFEFFIDILSANFFENGHWAPQVMFLQEIHFDFVGNIGKKSHLNFIANKLEISENFPYRNSSTFYGQPSSKDFIKTLSTETKNRIQKMYSSDYSLLKNLPASGFYEKEIPSLC